MSNYQYLDDTGVIVPDTASLQSDVDAEWVAAFGADLSTDPETPQGVMITGEVEARSQVVRNNAALANQINPNVAGGVFLAAICALTGLDPPAGTFSTIAAPNVVLTGVQGSNIPAGTQAKTAAGDIFQTTTTVALDPVTGQATTGAQALAVGPIACAAHALSTGGGGQLINPPLGLETIDNLTAAALGQDSLSDVALRTLRNNTLALQGMSETEAITSALADPTQTPGVLSFKIRENVKPIAQVIDGINLDAKSIWVCVDGGTDDDVAATLLNTKSGGCDWNGAVVVAVLDIHTGQTYQVKFDRPTDVPVYVNITARVPGAANPIQAVQQAILDYAAGAISTFPGFVTGASVSPFELGGAVMEEIPGAYVKLVEISLASGGPFQTTEIPMAINQKATITQVAIAVTLLP